MLIFSVAKVNVVAIYTILEDCFPKLKGDIIVDNKSKKKKNKGRAFHSLINISQIGFTMVAAIFIGVLIGKFLDDAFNTTPWFLLVFSLMGVGAAIKSIFNFSKDIGKGKKKDGN